MAAACVFRVESGNAVQAHLDASDDPNLQSVAFQHHVGFNEDVQAIVESDVGADEGKVGPFRHLADTLRTVVPLVITQGAEVEPESIHQVDHGARRLHKAVVERIARTVVTRREQLVVARHGEQIARDDDSCVLHNPSFSEFFL